MMRGSKYIRSKIYHYFYWELFRPRNDVQEEHNNKAILKYGMHE